MAEYWGNFFRNTLYQQNEGLLPVATDIVS